MVEGQRDVVCLPELYNILYPIRKLVDVIWHQIFSTPGRSLIQGVTKVIESRQRNPALQRSDLLQMMLDARMAEEDIENVTVKHLTSGEDEPTNDVSNDEKGEHKNNTSQRLKTNYILRGVLNYTTVNKLRYLNQVFSEYLRLYPPVVGFLPENKKDIHPMAYQAFRSGPRNCIGMRMGQLQAKLALCRILRAYMLVPSEKTEIGDIQDNVKFVTVVPGRGIHLKVVPV
ncbi:cytochrome P450 3A21-like [Tachypleus tridentatus]|uniref:cytochrome P450 3A21-like n=1 Tax=Tachypleus tridentatus TaxID=6853 RepID=UPI003FD260C2